MLNNKFRNSNLTEYYYEQLNYRFYKIGLENTFQFYYLEILRALYLPKLVDLNFIDKFKLCLDSDRIDRFLEKNKIRHTRNGNLSALNYYFLMKSNDEIFLRYIHFDAMKNIFIDNIKPLSDQRLFVFAGTKLFIPAN
ncbi:MAG: hypothetical protein IPK88_18125 [Saprospiraceae bacterium]|nr:hypothetical protein [Candidatus Defluviibacterium haderslevense]